MTEPGTPLPHLRPRMSEAEIAMLETFAREKPQLIEYGCGGSTLLNIRHADTVVSVESDPDWIERISTHEAISAALGQGQLHLLHADIGPVGEWGYPLDPDSADRWPGYWRAPWSLLERTGRPHRDGPRLILIDGRFRVACALYSALRMRPGDVILLHDFEPQRGYEVLLDHLTPIARRDTLVALTPGRRSGRRAMRRTLRQHARTVV